MYKHILLPTDGSKLSTKGVQQAIKMARALRAKITAVHVVASYHQLLRDQEDGFMMPVIATLKEDFEDRAAARAKEILSPVKEAASKAGVRCDTVTAIGDFPFEAIIKQARKSKCDLIMMASHGRSGIKGLLLGSETAKVLTHSKIPVLVVR
jgi:nucleotide-binding universal stress UspA family protein